MRAAQRLGNQLQRLRTRRGLTQEQLAVNVGLSRTFITRLELGQYDPTLSTMVRLAKALRVSVTDLSGESMPTPWATCLSPVTRTSQRAPSGVCFLFATRNPAGSKVEIQGWTRISLGEFLAMS